MTAELGSDERVASLVGRLLIDVDSLADELTVEIVDGEDSYAESTVLDRDRLRTVVRDNLLTLLTTLRGGPSTLEAPRAAGRSRPSRASRWPRCSTPTGWPGGSSGTGCSC